MPENEAYFYELHPEFKPKAEPAADAAQKDASAGDENADKTADDTAASDDHANEEQDQEEHEGDEQPNRKKGGFQRRIEKLNGKLSAKEQEIAELRRQLASGAKPETKADDKPATDPSDPKPKAKEGQSAEEYLDELTDWKLRQQQKAAAKSAAEAKANAARAEQEKTWQEREAKAKEQLSKEEVDYDEAVTDFVERANARKVAVSQAMKDFVNESEFGPQLLYKIATMKDAEVNELAKLTPLKLAAQLLKIEAQFAPKESASQAEEADVTPAKAPAPIKPVGTRATTARITDPMQAAMKGDFVAFEKLMDERDRKRR